MMPRVIIPNQQVKYDEKNDILHVYFLPSTSSYDDEDYPGIIIRRSMVDERITGVIIMDYSKQDRDTLKRLLPFLDIDRIQVQDN